MVSLAKKETVNRFSTLMGMGKTLNDRQTRPSHRYARFWGFVGKGMTMSQCHPSHRNYLTKGLGSLFTSSVSWTCKQLLLNLTTSWWLYLSEYRPFVLCGSVGVLEKA